MPVPLSETWGGVYIQLIVVLFVFALGIPTLLVQVAFPQELQRALGRDLFGGKASMLLMMFFYISIAILFIWDLKPYPSRAGNRWEDLSAGIVITGMLILTVLLWWEYSLYNQREYLLDRLVRRGERLLKRKGIVDEDVTEAIAFLGAQAKSSHEKKQALNMLERLANSEIQRNPYKGNSLLPVISAAEVVVSGGEGSSTGHQEALHLLANLRRAMESKALSECPDYQRANLAIRRLGIEAAQAQSDAILLAFIEELAESSWELFEVGLVCVERRRYLAALSVLAKTNALCGGTLNRENHDCLNFIAMCAHFWMVGEAAQHHIRRMLQNDFPDASTSAVTELLNSSIESLSKLGRFDTSNHLGRMRDEF
jgi:hypothetical protein